MVKLSKEQRRNKKKKLQRRAKEQEVAIPIRTSPQYAQGTGAGTTWIAIQGDIWENAGEMDKSKMIMVELSESLLV